MTGLAGLAAVPAVWVRLLRAGGVGGVWRRCRVVWCAAGAVGVGGGAGSREHVGVGAGF